MYRKYWYALGSGVAAVAVLAGAFAVAYAQQPTAAPADRTKDRIEVGAKTVVGQPQPAGAPATNPFAQPATNPYAQQRLDVGKNRIETGTKAVFAQGFPAPNFPLAAQPPAASAPTADVRKGRIEQPTEALLAKALADAAARDAADKAFVNPQVPPGKVNWHTDFAAARRASAKTGRPVLLFQMMGHLDNKFC